MKDTLLDYILATASITCIFGGAVMNLGAPGRQVACIIAGALIGMYGIIRDAEKKERAL